MTEKEVRDAIEIRRKQEEQLQKESQAVQELLLSVGIEIPDHSIKTLRKWIKEFSFEEVFKSTETALDRYFENTRETAILALNYIPRILYSRIKEKTDPALYWKNYIMKAIRCNFDFEDESLVKDYLNMLIHSEEDFEELKALVMECSNWEEFQSECEERME